MPTNYFFFVNSYSPHNGNMITESLNSFTTLVVTMLLVYLVSKRNLIPLGEFCTRNHCFFVTPNTDGPIMQVCSYIFLLK